MSAWFQERNLGRNSLQKVEHRETPYTHILLRFKEQVKIDALRTIETLQKYENLRARRAFLSRLKQSKNKHTKAAS